MLAGWTTLVGAGLDLAAMPAALLTACALWLGVAFARPLINLLFEGGRARLFLINTGHDWQFCSSRLSSSDCSELGGLIMEYMLIIGADESMPLPRTGRARF